MKSKVILFCVLLFCSKFVDSVPHSEELVRQRAFQPTNWPANKYAAGQYVDTNFAQTQNENVLKTSGLQLENNQEYFANQGTRGFGNQGYNKGLSSSLIGKERLLNYAPSVEEERVNSYPIRSHSYQSNAPQIGLDNQQFGYQNWRPQNQYNAANVQEVIPNNDRPLVTTVQEPYRGPVQYVKPQFIPPVNRRHHSVNRYYPAREQLQYPIDNIGLPSSVSTKYVQNSAPLSVVRESVPYDNYGNGQGIASNNNAGVIASKQFYASESASPYNGAPDAISSEVLPEESGDSGYEVIQNSQTDSANSAGVTTINNNAQDVADSYNIENRPSTLVPVDNKAEAASIIQKVLADKPLVRRYSHNYRPGTNFNNYARESSYNGASVGQTNTYGINSGNVNNNYGSGLVLNKPSPVNTYSKPAPSASSHADVVLNLGHKNAEAVPQYTSTTTAPVATTNSENDFYRQLTSGIHQYDLKNIASHPKIKDLLAVNNKPYVLIHANGSVEYFDKFDLDAKENSKYRLIHTKHTPLGKPQNVQGDKVLKPQPPALVPTSSTTPALVPITSTTPAFVPTSTTTPAPNQLVNGGVSKPLPSSNEWADDDSSYVNQPADDKTAQLSPLYRKHHGIDNYSTSPHPHVNSPAGDDDFQPSISNVNQPQDDTTTTTKPLVSTESQSSVSESKSVSVDHPDKNVNNKATPSDDGLISDDVNQPDDDSTPKTLVSKDGQSSNTDDSTSVFTSGNQSDKNNNDNDDTKSLPDNVNQPDDDSTPKPLTSHNDKPSSGNNDDDLSSAPNAQQPDDNNTPKPGAPKKTSVVTDDSEQVSSKVNKSDNDDNNNSQPLNENQPDNDDSSSTPSTNPPNDSTPKPLSPKDNQSPNQDDSKSLSADSNTSGNGDDDKPQNHSPKDNQPNDDDDDSSSISNVNGKNDQSSPKKDNQSPNDDDSNSSPSNLDQSDDNSNSNTNEDSSITDNSPTSTTPSSVVSDQHTSPTPVVQSTPSNKDDSVSSTTASSDVTTPSADTTTEDEIITISPIEQATDNVSDAPATTTTKPTYTHPRFHIGTPKSDKKDIAQDDKTASSSDTDKKQISTQESQSSTVSQSDSTSDTNQNVIQKNTEQQHSESAVSQTKTTKNDSNTAVDNSLTNTDVPAESDDNSPVSPSIRIDVNTGDDVNTPPGDNSLESEQSETDVKITVSAVDDSEDDIIAITIEVSESAGDADREDKSVVIKVKTDDNDSADSKTSNASDCEKNKTSKDVNTNQNLEIDMATIEGEPTMWIRTTNQDFVEKLASKNDTQFDVIYFFNMNPQPTIEREKVTTIHCNGTVVIEKTETSYASQDDKTPKIVKTTTVLQIEDYKP